jgi:hypothetical protein
VCGDFGAFNHRRLAAADWFVAAADNNTRLICGLPFPKGFSTGTDAFGKLQRPKEWACLQLNLWHTFLTLNPILSTKPKARFEP